MNGWISIRTVNTIRIRSFSVIIYIDNSSLRSELRKTGLQAAGGDRGRPLFDLCTA